MLCVAKKKNTLSRSTLQMYVKKIWHCSYGVLRKKCLNFDVQKKLKTILEMKRVKKC